MSTRAVADVASGSIVVYSAGQKRDGTGTTFIECPLFRAALLLYGYQERLALNPLSEEKIVGVFPVTVVMPVSCLSIAKCL